MGVGRRGRGGAGIKEAVKARKARERLQPTGHNPVVAVVLGATSAKVRFDTLAANPLFTKLLPSLAPTVEEGYEYWVYVGYDSGDLFYDDALRLRAMSKWFRRNVARPCRLKRVLAKVVFLNFTNVLRKPGPVFNFVAAAALDDGADYLFRVNDDTEIATPGWAGKMADCLANFKPANLGDSLAPLCRCDPPPSPAPDPPHPATHFKPFYCALAATVAAARQFALTCVHLLCDMLDLSKARPVGDAGTCSMLHERMRHDA